MLSWSNLSGNDCNLPELESSFQRLYENVDAVHAVYALELADSLIRVMEDMGKEECPLFLWILYEKGEALELNSKPEEALNLYYSLAREAEKSENWELAAQVYISIARVHEPIRRPNDCLRNLMEAKKIIDEHQLNAVYSRFAVRYASYHRFYDNRDSARHYAAIAVDYGKKYEVQRSEMDGHLLLGMLNSQLDTSIYHFQQAININPDRKDFYGATFQQLNITKRFQNAGLIENAFSSLDTAYYYADQMSEAYPNYFRVYQLLHDFKHKLYEEKGMRDSSYHYFKKATEADRYANIQVNQQEITEQETSFAIEKEQVKLRFEKQRSSYLTWGMVLMLLLLGFMALGHFNNERKKRFISKQKDLIATKNEALNNALKQQSILLSEVHHRVKNNLQLIMSLIALKGNKIPEEHVKVHFDDLSNKVHSIALIHEQLYRSGEFESILVQDYFSHLANYLKSLDNEDDPFLIQIASKDIVLNLETVLPLGLIFTELISNSLKYARHPGQQLMINFSIKQIGDEYVFRYKDNGLGYPNEKLIPNSNSIGAMLISSMVRQLMGESETSNKNGAVFTLNFKEKQVSSV